MHNMPHNLNDLLRKAVHGTGADWIDIREAMKRNDRPDVAAWLCEKRALHTGESLLYLLDVQPGQTEPCRGPGDLPPKAELTHLNACAGPSPADRDAKRRFAHST